MRTSLSLVLGGMSLAVVSAVMPAESPLANAVKLAVEIRESAVPTGRDAEATVELRDAEDGIVRPSGAVPVILDVTYPSGHEEHVEVTIPPGERSATASIAVREPGLVKVRATEKELLSGTAVLIGMPAIPEAEVLGGPNEESRHGPTSEGASPGPTATPTPPAAGGGHRGGNREAQIGAGGARERELARRQAPSHTLATPTVGAPAPPPPPPVESLLLTLVATPDRALLADGRDTATVRVFIRGPEATYPEDVKVYLSSSDGQLDDTTPVVIQAGRNEGTVRLTSKQVGVVQVWFRYAEPSAQLTSVRPIELSFGPPITQLDVTSSPPSISLAEHASLLVRFMGADGMVYATDLPRAVLLTVTSGKGDLDPVELRIPPGQPNAWASLRPLQRGVVRISASTPGLKAVLVDVPVIAPLFLMMVSLIGSIAGGTVAAAVGKTKPAVRVVTGVVSGLALYWAAVSIPVVQDTLRAPVVASPITAAVISTLGGFLGSQALSVIMRAIGVLGGGT